MKTFFSECPVCNSKNIEEIFTTKDYFLSQELFSVLSCFNCGIHFTSPRPSSDELGSYYKSDDYFSHTDSKKNLTARIYFMIRKINLKMKFNLIEKYHQGISVLDIGCGTGEFLNYCKSKGKDVKGVEPGEVARNYAAIAHGISVEASLQLIEQPARFEVITMWHSLEHIPDLNGTLVRLREILAEDGLLIIAVPNCNSWDAVHYGTWWAGWDVPRHLFHFSEESLTKLMEKYGFSMISLHPQKFDSFYVSLLSERYKTGRVRYGNALLNGIKSNLNAPNRVYGYSSQIYLFKLKQAKPRQ